jgi:uncharacterized protein YecE (DUF72 family)
MKARIYIGTSGWSYPSGYGKWKGIFYPRRWSGDELAYYAERFHAVEVNSSFYRLPGVPTVRSWVERTPQEFRFTVKLYRKFTHPAFYTREEGQPPEITAADVAAVREMLDVLAENDRLGALLVQYPDLFYHNEANLAALAQTLDHFRAYPLAVELRNKSWRHPAAREVLAGAAVARIDEPLFHNLETPAGPEDPLQYWRLHGRNAEQWRRRNAGAHRYDYLYTPDEVDELADLIASRLHPDRPTFIFFNNHPGGQAAANAVSLSKRLKMPLDYAKFSHLADTFPYLKAITGENGGQMNLLGDNQA